MSDSDKIPDFVTSQAALAQLLGVHRNTIPAWLKLEGAPQHTPKGFDVKKWIDFAGKIAKRANVEKSNTKAEKELIKLDEVIRGLRLKNDQDDGLLIRIDETTETIHAVVSELNSEIRRIEDGLPQALLGLSLPEQRVVIRDFFDAMRAKINKGEKAIIG